MDTQSFDSPKPKTRRYQRKKASVETVTHSIIAVIPHTGWQLCIGEICDEQTRISDAGVYTEYSEYPQWLDTGGVLVIELNSVNSDNNKQICKLFDTAGHITYVHEPFATRHREVTLIEDAVGKPIDQFVYEDTVVIEELPMLIDEAITFVNCWQSVFDAWRSAYPGKRYVAVSERWADKQLPFPHHITVQSDGVDMGRGFKHWREHLSERGMSHSINPDYIAQFIQKVPMYAK